MTAESDLWPQGQDPLGIERPPGVWGRGAKSRSPGGTGSSALDGALGAEQIAYIDARQRLYWYQETLPPTMSALGKAIGAKELQDATAPVVSFCSGDKNSIGTESSCDSDVPGWWPGEPAAPICGLDGFAPMRDFATATGGNVERWAAGLMVPRTVVPTGNPLDMHFSSKGADIWFPIGVPLASLIKRLDIAFRVRPWAPPVQILILHAPWPPEAVDGLIKLKDKELKFQDLQTALPWEGTDESELIASVTVPWSTNVVLPSHGSVFLVIRLANKIPLDGRSRLGVMGARVIYHVSK